MTGNAQLSATIKVAQVKEFGVGKPSFVVDDTGSEWKFWTESKYGRGVPAEAFPAGAKVLVCYKVGQYNGKEERTITSVLDGQNTRPIPQAAQPKPAKQFRSSMDPEDALAASTTLLLAAFIQAKVVGLSVIELAGAKAIIRQGLSAEEKTVQIQRSEADFNDEIPGLGN